MWNLEEEETFHNKITLFRKTDTSDDNLLTYYFIKDRGNYYKCTYVLF